MITRRWAMLTGLGTAALSAMPALAQDYPNRPVHVICPLPPGTGADITVRFFAERLRQMTGMPMLVENRPGAGSTIAAEYVARSKPDGYTLFIDPGQGMASSVYLYRKLPHDVINDFAPITTLLKLPFVMAVAINSPVNSFSDLVARLRLKGDKASYGAATNFAQAAGTIVNDMLGLQAVAIPYKSTPDAINELNNDVIDYVWADGTFGLPLHRQGKLRIIAVTTAKRFSLEPSIPTLMESGLREFDLAAWWGAWFPAKTPELIIQKMQRWLTHILAEPQTVEFFSSVAPAEIFPGTPETLLQYLKDDIVRWTNALKAGNVQPQ